MKIDGFRMKIDGCSLANMPYAKFSNCEICKSYQHGIAFKTRPKYPIDNPDYLPKAEKWLESERAFQHEQKRPPAIHNALGPRLRGIRIGTDGEEVLWLKESIIIRGELGAGEEYIASRTVYTPGQSAPCHLTGELDLLVSLWYDSSVAISRGGVIDGNLARESWLQRKETIFSSGGLEMDRMDFSETKESKGQPQEPYCCDGTLFSTVDESGSPHSTHGFERNDSRSRLDSVGHKVSKHHFKVVQVASTPINEAMILATICATGYLVDP
ncbi:hypothetical protein PCH_Pc22g25860 [Penicillium rubens Wisconsin 54-1255]|uniref:Uncharacterized protein n=1 Tax=Penicillium rubens (strain ATCC 28089 / DSM 1075 / NRRL 1951 / Wisconsin 54-1255) TaxID=500485 RepID=B6HSZ8_PENRW|nr:hypothetical protein PCH_Pc22g25860 [Penicillium rubens Wisconsin 54-1255]